MDGQLNRRPCNYDLFSKMKNFSLLHSKNRLVLIDLCCMQDTIAIIMILVNDTTTHNNQLCGIRCEFDYNQQDYSIVSK